MTWRDQAVCLNESIPVDVFLPSWVNEEADGDATRLAHEIAKSYCRRCFVVAECLSYALLMNERAGVWGNTTPRERRRIKERERVSAA